MSRSGEEQAILDMWHWMGRVLQYSAEHPACAGLGLKALDGLTRVLSDGSPLVVGVLRDGLTIGVTPATNIALKTRTGPHFHERGAIALRFLPGVTSEELTTFIAISSLPSTEIFNSGGLRAMLTESGVSHVVIEELAHDLLEQEREVDRRQKKLGALLQRLLDGGTTHGGSGSGDGTGSSFGDGPAATPSELIEMLAQPKLVARLLESAEPPEAVAHAIASFAALILQTEQTTNTAPKLQIQLRAAIHDLAPEARDRLITNFPDLQEDARVRLAAVLAGIGDEGLATLVFPTVRFHPDELDRLFYTLLAVVSDDDARAAVVRRLGALLYDLPLDEPATFETLAILATPPAEVDEGDPFAVERAMLNSLAARVLAERECFRVKAVPVSPAADAFSAEALASIDDRSVGEIVLLASRLVDFPAFCERLPALASTLAKAERTGAILTLFRAAATVDDPRWSEVRVATLRALARSDAGRAIAADLHRQTEQGLMDLGPLLQLLGAEQPEALLAVLESTESRTLRVMLLDTLAAAGRAIVGPASARLASEVPSTVITMITLLRRAGASAAELAPATRHPLPSVRIEAARALRLPNDPTAGEALCVLLGDPVEEVQSAALTSLGGMMLGPGAVKVLELLVIDDRRPDELRKRAVDTLSRSTADEAAQILFRMLEPKVLIERPFQTALREQAAVALKRSRAPLAPSLLAEGLKSTAWRIRKACERALADKDG